MRIGTALDPVLDRLTRHQVTLYTLLGLVLWALVLSLLNVLHYSALDIAGATVLATCVTLGVNAAFARVLRAATDPQSTMITALILVLIIPIGLRDHALFLAGASVVAVASKYIATVDKQHVFNPVALALAALAPLFPGLAASWWVGTAAMLPAVVVGGVLVTLKTRQTRVVRTFLAAYLLLASFGTMLDSRSFASLVDVWRLSVVHTALLFFSFIMLTDPVTVPTAKVARHLYAGFVALLCATPELRFLGFGLTPEQALCIGNAASFAARPKYRLTLPLQRKYRAGADTWVFEYALERQRFAFAPGQFMEWTVPHAHPDGRGQRRTFTIASSPTERGVSVVMRIPTPSSSFKRALVGAEVGSVVIASRLSGDFVLPRDLSKPLAFIAGGVGIAPFRSMAEYIVDRGIRCDIVLLYSSRHADEFLFADTFEEANRLGLRTVYLLTDGVHVPADWKGRTGRVTAEVIRAEVPDFGERTFFLSGSRRMVGDMKTVLRGLGVRNRRIRTDCFDGSVDG